MPDDVRKKVMANVQLYRGHWGIRQSMTRVFAIEESCIAKGSACKLEGSCTDQGSACNQTSLIMLNKHLTPMQTAAYIPIPKHPLRTMVEHDESQCGNAHCSRAINPS